MSVRRLGNGAMVVTLGDGDTMISTARSPHLTEHNSIVFYNAPARTARHDEEYRLHGDEVVLCVTDVTGVLSLFRAVADMVATWEIGEDLRVQWAAWAQELDLIVERLRHQMGVGGEQPAETRITVTIDVQTWQGYHDRRVIEVEPGIGWPERMAPEVLKAALEMEEQFLSRGLQQNGGEGR